MAKNKNPLVGLAVWDIDANTCAVTGPYRILEARFDPDQVKLQDVKTGRVVWAHGDDLRPWTEDS